MKKGFYRKLAFGGIIKNKKTYLPYILTCIGMVMMYYIISFLTVSRTVSAMGGGDTMQMVLGLGTGVIAVFAVIFLFYTNSFLIRRRKKEFGLYNVLGMGKKNLFRVLFWETTIVAGISLMGGLICGILFSKLSELVMAKMLMAETTFVFTVEWSAVTKTMVLFMVIFALIFFNGIRQIHLSKPLELMRSEAVGEKPPRAKWMATVLGIGLLAYAYYLAVSIKNPLSAMLIFFVAVILVIIATYLLFLAGSVVLCRLLQKNKTYYYRTNHFVSVSSMAYRMKRNGAGLATICILSTMVLVMISSTACMFFGEEDSLRRRYPRNVVLDTYSLDETYTRPVHDVIQKVVDSHGLLQENLLHYRYLNVGGYQQENKVIFDMDKLKDFSISNYGNVKELFVVPLDDYNRLMGTQETLEDKEVLLYTTKSEYLYDTIEIEGCESLKVKKTVSGFVDNGTDAMQMIGSIFLFVPNMDIMEQIFQVQAEIYGDNRSYQHDYYGFDLDCGDEEMKQAYQEISEGIQELQLADSAFPAVSSECMALEKTAFYALYGGMFFLGVLLGLVFILAAVLIIYYKQVSEGYEDQERFEIMQKVGMTKKEIRRSINSQMLTVFFLPLLAAGIHVMFAFPLIQKILLMFNLTNVKLYMIIMAVCYLLFTLFYVIIYRVTSRAYYSIVSTKN